MKLEEVKTHIMSAVSNKTDVIISVDYEESQKLRDALAFIEKYKKLAFQAFKEKKKYFPNKSDWHMVSYGVKNDKVIVSIEDGMTG